MKAFSTAAALIVCLATSSLAVFIDPSTASADKTYELHDAKNQSLVLAASDNDILTVQNIGGDFVSIQRRAIFNAKQAFTFPNGIAGQGEVRKENPSFTTSASTQDANNRVGEVKQSANARVAGAFTVKGSDSNGVLVEEDSQGLGVVLKTSDGKFVGLQEGQFTNGQPASKVDQEYVWKLVEVNKSGSEEGEGEGQVTIQTIQPSSTASSVAAGGQFTIETIGSAETGVVSRRMHRKRAVSMIF